MANLGARGPSLSRVMTIVPTTTSRKSPDASLLPPTIASFLVSGLTVNETTGGEARSLSVRPTSSDASDRREILGFQMPRAVMFLLTKVANGFRMALRRTLQTPALAPHPVKGTAASFA